MDPTVQPPNLFKSLRVEDAFFKALDELNGVCLNDLRLWSLYFCFCFLFFCVFFFLFSINDFRNVLLCETVETPQDQGPLTGQEGTDPHRNVHIERTKKKKKKEKRSCTK